MAYAQHLDPHQFWRDHDGVAAVAGDRIDLLQPRRRVPIGIEIGAIAIQTARSARRAALTRGFQLQVCQIAPNWMLKAGILTTESTATIANLFCPSCMESSSEHGARMGRIENSVKSGRGWSQDLGQISVLR
jgi:hypothetical protein